MRLTTPLLALSLIVSLLASFIPGNSLRASQTETIKQEKFTNIVNGKNNPSLISDTVAYDVFFRSLVSSPRESAATQSRLRDLARKMGIAAGDADAIRAVAEEFSQNVALFDEQAGAIKDKHLPNLTPEDANQLTDLQKQKEALITSTVASLIGRLGRRLADALRLHITGYVKPRVRSMQVPPSNHRHDSAGRGNAGAFHILKAGYNPARSYFGIGMNGYGHLYMDGWQDTGAGLVYGHSLLTEDYNNYGHTWSVNTMIYNPDGTRSQSNLVEWYRATTSSTTALSIGDDFGDFFIEAEIKEKCPYIFTLIALGVLTHPKPYHPS
jgi:hypothetical protein